MQVQFEELTDSQWSLLSYYLHRGKFTELAEKNGGCLTILVDSVRNG